MKSKVFLTGLLALLVLLVFACATNNRANSDFSGAAAVTAKGVPEGIIINFNEIPEETIRLLIMLQDATENYETLTYVDISDNELEGLKNSGNLICPFTKDGHVYRISVISYTEQNVFPENCINVAAIAKGGSYPEYTETARNIAYENLLWTIGTTEVLETAGLIALY